ncbi:hypothetical protein [Mesorhizobium sp.]|uniref:hypothetical protein n=1 Tax=Mesorhizobium sp. TaxID=1871066 RepID=UPI00257F3013|nr:hypothetical protein [Mesorhizobium sp.]
MILEKLRACWAFSPTVDRNVALVEGFLKGKSFADLAQEHSLSKLRVRQIIEKADRLVGGGILTKAEPSKASPRSDFMATIHMCGTWPRCTGSVASRRIISLRSWNAQDRWSGWLTR